MSRCSSAAGNHRSRRPGRCRDDRKKQLEHCSLAHDRHHTPPALPEADRWSGQVRFILGNRCGRTPSPALRAPSPGGRGSFDSWRSLMSGALTRGGNRAALGHRRAFPGGVRRAILVQYRLNRVCTPAPDDSPQVDPHQSPTVAANWWRMHMKFKAGVPDLSSRLFAVAFGMMCQLAMPALCLADTPPALEKLGAEFAREIRPILDQSCMKCHATDEQKGTLDLEQFEKIEDVRRSTTNVAQGRRDARQRRDATQERTSADRRKDGSGCGPGWPII